jgi:hypothetical protein
LGEELLNSFRAYAEEQGRSMAGVLHRWIEEAVGGTPPAPASPAGASSEPAVAAAAAVAAVAAELQVGVLAELKVQMALLQQLVHQAAAIPHGVAVAQEPVQAVPVVITEDLPAPATPVVVEAERLLGFHRSQQQNELAQWLKAD